MTIGIWGDSIVYGSCDTEALGWAGRLRRALPTGDYHALYNFGICGDTSADILKRFEIEVDATKPDRIVFAVGINDSKFPNDTSEHNVSLAAFENNLQELTITAQKYTAAITIVGATKVADVLRTARGSRFLSEEIQRFNDVMKRVADRHSLLYIDVFDVLDPASDLYDGLHPNTLGYEKLFESIKNKIVFV